MYNTFFGFSRRPFSATPDTQCCAGAGAVQEAYDALYDCFEQGKGIGILTGPAGTGKTLLCRKLLTDLRDRFRGIFLDSANFHSPRALFQAMLYELERPYRDRDEQELRLELTTAARETVKDGRPGILVAIDEAHNLGLELLEEIRSMTNLIEQGEPLVCVLLCGQVSLEETLADPSLAALNQRIGCHQTLNPLTGAESIDYIAYRLSLAGAACSDIFDDEAIRVIAEVSDGNPRCLNQLCDHALCLAFAEGRRPVGKAVVLRALDDVKKLPLQWNDSLAAAAEFSPVVDEETGVDDEGEGLPREFDGSGGASDTWETPEPDACGLSPAAEPIKDPFASQKPSPEQEPASASSTLEIGADSGQLLLLNTPGRSAQWETPANDVMEIAGRDRVDAGSPGRTGFDGMTEDEIVKDRYARLDARRQQRFRQTRSMEAGSVVLPAHRGGAVDDLLRSAWYTTDIEASVDPDNVTLFRPIVSLGGGEFGETRDAAVLTSGASDPRSEVHQPPDMEIEEQLGETVLDTLQQARQAAGPRLPDADGLAGDDQRADDSVPLYTNGDRLKLPIDLKLRHLEADPDHGRDAMVVYEPEPTPGGSSDEAASASGRAGRANFDQLFSSLRRRRPA